MLLFDRVVERLHWLRKRDPDRWNESPDAGLLRALRGIPVYELSAVTPLFGDWETERLKRVPRRPPCDALWAEWTVPSVAEITVRMGVTAFVLGPDGAGKAILDTVVGAADPETADRIRCSAQVYGTNVFTVLERDASGNLGEWIGVPRYVDSCCVFFLGKDGTEIDQRVRRYPAHGPPVLSTPHVDGEAIDWANPWPMFMAFALLHCRNVVTTEHVPDQRLQRRVERAGNPPRVTFKTLSVEVPRTIQVNRQPGDGSGPPRRFHLCSGHFRELRSEKFTNRQGEWVWVQAHWRGDPNLGAVVKDYRVEAGEVPG